MSELAGQPTAAELVAAVAEFLETEVAEATTGAVKFHNRVAVGVLRMVERELLADAPDRTQTRLAGLGFADEAAFAAAPSGPSVFRTVNGRVTVTLPGTLSADLRLKTLHGGLYTDFDTTPLPTRATAERREGRLVFRPDRHASVRVGSGGPELTFETINGDVEVRKQK